MNRTKYEEMHKNMKHEHMRTLEHDMYDQAKSQPKDFKIRENYAVKQIYNT